MRLRRLSAALVAVGTFAALSAVAPTAAQAAARKVADGTATSVTLITGDRVTFSDRGGVSVQRAPGREKIRFVGRVSEGHRYVIPTDALPLLEAKKIDQRLFDLTALEDFGYTGDAVLPLLLAYPKNSKRKPATATTARVTRDLTEVGALAVDVPLADRGDSWVSMRQDKNVERIYLDGKRKINLDVSVPQIGAPAAWAEGLDGTGVTVAILDTGIDATHPDFAGKIVAQENFTSLPTADDNVGHGTHVASIIAGSGAKSGGKYKGVAPGAKLAIGKVCEVEWCEESAILAGMEWGAQAAPIVNMSLGGGDAPGIDPLEQAVEDLTAAHGSLFVIAAGNDGYFGDHTVGSPGSADSALTVGAVDREDKIADFSSRGPRVGDDAIKPDITAPGVEIVAAQAANGFIGTPAADGYVALSGTSMATPHVAGAAAIVTQQHPGWSPKQRKTLLMGAAKPTEGASVFEQGAGRVDVARVVHQAVSVDEGSVSFGLQQWPHDDDAPITKTITYRNGGTAPVTLALTLQGDTGTFELGATSVTVPAGGTAATTVTADTRGDGSDGFLTGRVVATGGDVKVETPVAVNREVESYDVTFSHIGRDGEGATDYLTVLTSLADGRAYDMFGGDADAKIRLPKGEYGLFSWIWGPEDLSFLVQPKLVVDGPDTIKLDARRGKPVVVTPPRRDASQALVGVNADWSGENFSSGASALSGTPGDTFTAQIGGSGKVDQFTASINSVFAKADAEGGFLNSPYTYEASWLRKGSFYNGYVKTIDPSTLAQVKTNYNQEAAGEGVIGVKINWPNLGDIGGWAAGLPFRTPFQRTEWLNTDGPTSWSADFEQDYQPDPGEFPEFLSGSSAPDAKLKAGQVYKQDWNRAVFAPSVNGDVDTAVRYGDVIVAGVPLFSEGSGHLGWSQYDEARTALYSGNTLIGENAGDYGEFEVPAGAAPYRLEMSASRGTPHRLSTAVSASWTFTSDTGEEYRLPLSTVRFSPKLDETNSAPAGAFNVPATVERPKGSTAKPNRQFTAEFSTDDGRSWQPARVTGAGDDRVIKVTNPASGAVSLRVHTIDGAGNTASITVVKAYVVG
ncbi:serine protease [Actinoplanes sp. NBRC 103695]|nr:serine protease [Actinoplanes sp. NBRC 103695]